MHENFKLLLTRQKKKIELGTISGIDQYGYAYHRANLVLVSKTAQFKSYAAELLSHQFKIKWFQYKRIKINGH